MNHLLLLFRKHKDGATAIEFALIAPVFFLLFMGLFEIGLVMFYTTAIENATSFGARIGKVDFSQEDRDTYIKSQIRAQLNGVLTLPSGDGPFSILSYDSFDNIGKPEPYTDTNNNGKYDQGEPFTDKNNTNAWEADQGTAGPGDAGDIVQYRVTYNYNFATPMVGKFFPNPLPITGIAVIRNEPE
jgi:Flp pilus assembly protein TadG